MLEALHELVRANHSIIVLVDYFEGHLEFLIVDQVSSFCGPGDELGESDLAVIVRVDRSEQRRYVHAFIN